MKRILRKLLFLLLPVACIQTASAGTPDWQIGTATLVSPKEAKSILGEPAAAPMAAASRSVPQQLAASAQPDYARLAEALENDPLRIYQFVRNHFEYVPYYGALKGAHLTLLERSGNDFDQAALLVELLRAAGFTANYQYGTMSIPVSGGNGMDLAAWLGTDADSSIIGGIIASGGIPATNFGTSFTLDRIWVVVDVGGASYSLDPAFKPSNRIAGIDVAAAMGYSEAALLSVAGGTLGTDSIANLNQAAVNSHLDGLTNTLVAYLRQNHPNDRLRDIVGGRVIVADDSVALPGILPFNATPTEPLWTDIPANYVHTVRFRHGGIDQTYDIPLIAGEKLSIHYLGDDTPVDPPLPGAVDFGTVGDVDGPTITWTPSNPNSVTIQVTSTLTGSGAFSFASGGGTQNIPPNGSVNVGVKFSGIGQPAGRHNAVLTFTYEYNGSVIGTQNVDVTGVVEVTPVAEIYLDDTLLVAEASPSGNLTDFVLTVDHPYANNSGAYADQTVTFKLNRSNGTYVLASAFGGDRHSRLLPERQRILNNMKLQNLADDSREVLSETLNVIGQSWMQQTQLNAELTGALSDQRILRHHRFGMVGQEEGYFVDIKAQFASILPETSGAAEGAFQASGFVASAMEHSVLEQLQGVDNPAVSTIKIFALNNQNGDRFFLANQANYTSIQPQLIGYSARDLSGFQTAVNNSSTLILPENGQVNLNQWTGKGYVDYRLNGSSRGLSMIIGGGLAGGFASFPELISTPEVQNQSIVQNLPPANVGRNTAADPVDLNSGAFLSRMTDISIAGQGPRGLSFTRQYNSQQISQDLAGLGRGWTHSYNIYLTRHSEVESALGMRTPLDAAPLMVSAYLTRNLLEAEQPTLQNWMVSALVADWATTQLLDKSVTLHLGDQALAFRQLPDGSFVSPPGVTAELVKRPDASFELRERFGTVLAFNSDNKISSLTDIDGNALTFLYAGTQLVQVKDSYDRALTLGYAGKQLTSVDDGFGRSITYTQTGDDLTGVTGLENASWSYSYDPLHRMLTAVDPDLTVIVSNTYDQSDRVIEQQAPRESGTTTYKMHYTGSSSAEEDPLGHRITYFYDAEGRTIAVEDALGHVNRTEYDGQGHGRQYTDAKGRASSLLYDGQHNLIEVQDARSQVSRFEYDGQHRLIRAIDPLLHDSETDFDTQHHAIAERDTLNNEATATYRPDGLLDTSTDPRGITTTYTYDANGYPATTRTGSQPAIQTQYDGLGRLTSLTDRAGATTAFLYDDRGLVTERTDPLARTTINQYNELGQLIAQTDRNGDTTTSYYTASRKLDLLSFPARPADGTRPAVPGFNVSFDYADPRDLLTSMTDPLGSTSNQYDMLGRLISHTDPNGFNVQYTYDETGSLAALIYPDGKTVSYQYDELDRVSGISIDWLNQAATPAYDAAGRLTTISNFNGTASDYAYDDADRLTGLTHHINPQTTTDHQFTLDPNGNRVQAVIENEAILPTGWLEQTRTQTFNTAKNRLLTNATGTETHTFNYDAEGQTEEKSSASTQTDYLFDAAHRLISYTSGANQADYQYDGLGNRLIATRNGVTTQYIYDAAGNLLAEADNAGQIQRYYIHGLGLMAMVDAQTNQVYVYHHDATGHTVAMSDGNQQVVNKYAYSPFGQLLAKEEAIPQPFTYAGQAGVYTEADGLYYMRARYYDARIGRFISEDPIGLVGGLNLYAYAGGNPIRFIDPSGLGPESGGLGSALLDFGLGFIPGYDLYQAITDPGATGFDVFLGAVSVVPGAGKAVGLIGKGLKSGSTVLYRAVSRAELDDIAANGLRTVPGGYETGKLFASNLDDAARFGRNNFQLDNVPNYLVEVEVPDSVMKGAFSFTADGMKAISIPANQLNKLNANPLNYSPLVR